MVTNIFLWTWRVQKAWPAPATKQQAVLDGGFLRPNKPFRLIPTPAKKLEKSVRQSIVVVYIIFYPYFSRIFEPYEPILCEKIAK